MGKSAERVAGWLESNGEIGGLVWPGITLVFFPYSPSFLASHLIHFSFPPSLLKYGRRVEHRAMA